MKQPKILSKIWAHLGLKNTIPNTRTDELAQSSATYEEGFPSITMTPINLGGKAPSGKDMNGILHDITEHLVFQNQGGYYLFNATLADEINGYSKGAVLINNTYTALFVSLVNENKVDFNTENDYSRNWVKIADIDAIKAVKPKKLTADTQNHTDNTGHTHEIEKASTTAVGLVQLDSSTNSNAEEKAATPKAVKTAFDKAKSAMDKANEVDNNALKKTGNQTLTGILRTNPQQGWAAMQFGTNRSFWQMEFHNEADNANNRRLNIFYQDGNNRRYLAFPTIGNGNETVAYQSWVDMQIQLKFTSKKSNAIDSNSTETIATSKAVKDVNDRVNDCVSKSGDTMTGDLTLPHLSVEKTNALIILKSTTAKVSGIEFINANGSYPQCAIQAADTGHWGDELRFFTTPNGANYSTDRRQHTMTLAINGDIWTKTYGWLHDFFLSKNAFSQVAKANVTRRNYQRTSKVGRSYNEISYETAGSVTVYPDGRIVQLFHLKSIQPILFPYEDAGIGVGGDRHMTISIPLWTAMPNSIINAQAQPIRAVNETMSTTFTAEAGEWITGWQLFKNMNVRDRVDINISRFRGGHDEFIDLYVVVEGY